MTATVASPMPPISDLAGIGLLLQQLRVERRIATETVAQELHLQVRQINALEKGDFSGFNGSVFIKGYLRACSRLYGVDGDQLVNLYDSLSPPQPKNYLPVAIASAEKMVLTSGRSNKKILLILLLLVSLFAAAFFFWWRNGFALLPPMSPVAIPDVVSEAPVAVSSAPEPVVAENAVVESTVAESVAAPVLAEPSVPVQPANSSVMQPDISSATTQPGVPPPAEEIQDPILHIEFLDDCWVQLKTDDGKVLHEAVHKKGEIFDMPAQTPLHIWFGRAAAVNVSYNGTLVAVPSKPGFQSAQFVLGDEAPSGEME